MRFLEREVYTFCGKRVRGVMPWARIFFVYGRTAEDDVGQAMDRPRMGRRQRVWARGQSDTGGTACESCAGKREDRCFFGERLEGCLLCPLGIGRNRVAAIAALGIGTAAKTVRARVAARCGTATQLVAACGRRTQLIQLIYLRYLCVSTEREKRMDVCFLLTLYI